jgi:hypothetical protein
MRRLGLIALAALCTVSCASLAERYEKGNKALSTPDGLAYTVWIAPVLRSALNACIPVGTPSPSPRLVLVADILASGKATNVNVEPPSPGADCIADQVEETPLRPPPLPAGEGSYPIGIRIDLEPMPPG